MTEPLARLLADRAACENDLAAWRERGRHDALHRLAWHSVAALAAEPTPRHLNERRRARLAWLADDASLFGARADQIAAFLDGVRAVHDTVLGATSG